MMFCLDIMDLLNLCLTLTNFQYNDKHYKWLHGIAWALVAEIVMQNIEEQARATYPVCVEYTSLVMLC